MAEKCEHGKVWGECCGSYECRGCGATVAPWNGQVDCTNCRPVKSGEESPKKPEEPALICTACEHSDHFRCIGGEKCGCTDGPYHERGSKVQSGAMACGCPEGVTCAKCGEDPAPELDVSPASADEDELVVIGALSSGEERTPVKRDVAGSTPVEPAKSGEDIPVIEPPSGVIDSFSDFAQGSVFGPSVLEAASRRIAQGLGVDPKVIGSAVCGSPYRGDQNWLCQLEAGHYVVGGVGFEASRHRRGGLTWLECEAREGCGLEHGHRGRCEIDEGADLGKPFHECEPWCDLVGEHDECVASRTDENGNTVEYRGLGSGSSLNVRGEVARTADVIASLKASDVTVKGEDVGPFKYGEFGNRIDASDVEFKSLLKCGACARENCNECELEGCECDHESGPNEREPDLAEMRERLKRMGDEHSAAEVRRVVDEELAKAEHANTIGPIGKLNCPTCAGRGWLKGGSCVACKGTGRVDVFVKGRLDPDAVKNAIDDIKAKAGQPIYPDADKSVSCSSCKSMKAQMSGADARHEADKDQLGKFVVEVEQIKMTLEGQNPNSDSGIVAGINALRERVERSTKGRDDLAAKYQDEFGRANKLEADLEVERNEHTDTRNKHADTLERVGELRARNQQLYRVRLERDDLKAENERIEAFIQTRQHGSPDGFDRPYTGRAAENLRKAENQTRIKKASEQIREYFKQSSCDPLRPFDSKVFFGEHTFMAKDINIARARAFDRVIKAAISWHDCGLTKACYQNDAQSCDCDMAKSIRGLADSEFLLKEVEDMIKVIRDEGALRGKLRRFELDENLHPADQLRQLAGWLAEHRCATRGYPGFG